MNNSDFFKNIMIAALGCMIIIAYADFIRNPEKYGDIMRRYDEARFGIYEETE